MIKTNKSFRPIPDQYNGDLLDVSTENNLAYTVQADYLVLNLQGQPNFDKSSDFVYIPSEYGTKNFLERGEVVFQGQTIGTILSKPKGILDKRLSQLKLSNHLYYTMPCHKLKQLISELLKQMGVTFKSVSRLDIAIDMNGKDHNVYDIIKSIASQNILISGRPKEVKIFSQTEKGRLIFQGVQVGSRKTSRFMRLYNKTLEQQKAPKTYILDRWKEANLKGEIWRYEYQLSNKFLRNIKLSFDQLFSPHWLFEIFTLCQTGHFELKHNTGKTEVNKEQTFNWLCLHKVKKYTKIITIVINKIRRNINQTMIGQQRLIKGLLRSYFSTGQSAQYLTPVPSILKDYNLIQWYNGRIDRYLKEFKSKQLIKDFNQSKFKRDLAL